ncbi:MAG: DUF5069 domain-containing protein [Vampirovibrionales bacterium]|nr:DUF5069 domain-containing protein [Vampirovibrionales bacterium]
MAAFKFSSLAFSSGTQAPAAPDLAKTPPRSPGAMLGPFVLLPRILDKCRATLAETQGDYQFNCSLDRRFFDFTRIDPTFFKAEVAGGKTDEEMLAWVRKHSDAQDESKILAWTYQTRTNRPESPERMARFESLRLELCPDNPYVETWFELLDADEGRFPPRHR